MLRISVARRFAVQRWGGLGSVLRHGPPPAVIESRLLGGLNSEGSSIHRPRSGSDRDATPRRKSERPPGHRVPERRELFLREIADNRRALAECGLNPERLTHFCYPSGLYQSAFLPWLAEAGVVSAVTCVPGLASKRQHPLLLPRFIDTGRHRTWSSRVGLLDCATSLPDPE